MKEGKDDWRCPAVFVNLCVFLLGGCRVTSNWCPLLHHVDRQIFAVAGAQFTIFERVKHGQCIQSATRMQPICSFYEVLGVSRTATVAEIKAAFHVAALQHHPDKAQSADSSSFVQYQRAWEVRLPR